MVQIPENLTNYETFRPFRVVMDDGSTHDVLFRGHALVTPSMLLVGKFDHEPWTMDDLPEYMLTCHISRIRDVEFLDRRAEAAESV